MYICKFTNLWIYILKDFQKEAGALCWILQKGVRYQPPGA